MTTAKYEYDSMGLTYTFAKVELSFKEKLKNGVLVTATPGVADNASSPKLCLSWGLKWKHRWNWISGCIWNSKYHLSSAMTHKHPQLHIKSHVHATAMELWWQVKSLTHWGRDKMSAISQTILSNAFSWMKILELRLKFHWSLFPRVQLTISKHWFR